ncbi:porin family protein [Brevundimonas faecalis]|uniref:porin family protein n=1 Tax=Brevundimonas faecalis TaxID=947378 RepID=UPI003607845F
MRNLILAAAAVSVLATPVFAQSNPEPRGYGSLGYTHVDGDTASTGAVTGRLGVNLNRFLAVETEASVGVKKDDVTINGVEGNIKQEWDAAGYVVGKYPIGDKLELFARGGYGHTELKRNVDGAKADLGGDSWNYGVGANYYLDGVNGLRADWTRRDYRDNAGEADAYSVSYIRRF